MKRTKRIAIIGLPGSGKSTFAAKLGAVLNLPVHHLDKQMFTPGGKKRNKEEFIALQQEMLDQDGWIIEGCSTSTFEMRFAKAQTILYFRPSRPLCLFRALKRRFFPDKTLCDTAEGCSKVFTWEMVKYTWNFDQDKKPLITSLLEKYPHLEMHTLTTRRAIEDYLFNCTVSKNLS
jgi:adenylate kinase family enzyme